MTSEEIWNNEEPIGEVLEDLEVPAWIDQEISPSTIAAIVQGGCASGSYMPAVTYYDARQTMNEHGDDVLQYLEDTNGEIPEVPKGESWDGIACFYMSYAVELWAMGAHDQLEELAA
jgi:hypothetical protein